MHGRDASSWGNRPEVPIAGWPHGQDVRDDFDDSFRWADLLGTDWRPPAEGGDDDEDTEGASA